MEYSPPPLFKQGASARVKVMVFACISIALLLVDSHMRSLATIRQVAGTVLYPLQMAALLPRDAIYGVGDYFSTLSSMEKQVNEMKRQQILNSQALQLAQLQAAENAQLRRLLDARQQVPVKSMLAEVLYDARDVNSRKIILDRGSRNDVALGLPVIDNQGVVGQVTRVFPFTSEVTLLSDKEQAIPVQLLRNGLRSVAYGRGKSGNLELRFTAPNADIQVGDIVVTSGLDGVYPAGLAVARVTQVENSAGGSFGGVICQPLAGIANNTQLLILMSTPEMPPRPPAEELRAPRKGNNKMAPVKDVPKEGEGQPAATTSGAAPAAATPAANGTPGLIPVLPPPPAPKPAATDAAAAGATPAAAAVPPATQPAAAGAKPTAGATTPATQPAAAGVKPTAGATTPATQAAAGAGVKPAATNAAPAATVPAAQAPAAANKPKEPAR
ncbi:MULTISPECIES: rod shape-determining protein MreC [unclassified Duganella]|uniref:rod shape-determining protein MreC n=1 Tax=unclassified Duganella TaxID=2636909 RepID=UPI000A7045D3|nr:MULTISPECIES: rod shape-determining protein MreC [unclassified Duganella]